MLLNVPGLRSGDSAGRLIKTVARAWGVYRELCQGKLVLSGYSFTMNDRFLRHSPAGYKKSVEEVPPSQYTNVYVYGFMVVE